MLLPTPFGISTATAQTADQIRQSQETLNTLGYDAGTPDGTIGPHTRAAIRSYQETKGLGGSGELDDATWAALAAEGQSQPVQTPALAANSTDGNGALFLFLLVAGIIWYLVRRGQ